MPCLLSLLDVLVAQSFQRVFLTHWNKNPRCPDQARRTTLDPREEEAAWRPSERSGNSAALGLFVPDCGVYLSGLN